MRIRRLPGDRPTVTPEQIEALERELGASIDAFRATLDAAPPPDAAAEFGRSRAAEPFPAIDVSAGPWHASAGGAAPGPEIESDSAGGTDRSAVRDAAPEPEDVLAAAITGARTVLGRMISEIVRAKPLVRRSFVVGSGCDIDGLRVTDAYIDYQDPEFEMPAIPGAFTLHLKLVAPGAAALFVAPALRQATVEVLLQHDLAFTMRDGGDPGNQDVFFSVGREIRTSLLFRPDYGRRRVVVEARHLDMLGTSRYEVDPAVLDDEALARLGDFIAGQTERLPSFLVAQAAS